MKGTKETAMEQTFELVITGTENGEWQGRLTGQNGKRQDFNSLLELIDAVEKDACGETA